MAWLESLFWLSGAGVFYVYFGYPLLLACFARLFGRPVEARDAAAVPTVSMIVPVHNERATIEHKVRNAAQLNYPDGRLEILFVSDGSTDGTVEYLLGAVGGRTVLHELTERGGKAAALNAGLRAARHDIIVFSDASIMLEPGSLYAIVRPFQDPHVGCVSGEDRIAELGGEGLYGRYELFIRRLESKLHSIVGASGSFYAQRRALCETFPPGLAPDFLSVLRTVEHGYRAVAAHDAVGSMRALDSHRDEFQRKVRTLLRGMTTLRQYSHLLNPFAYGWFAFVLMSHKLIRWLFPFFLIGALATSGLLATWSGLYRRLLLAQVLVYAVAACGLFPGKAIASSLPVRVFGYFATVTLATLSAWAKFIAGARQELWSPSRR
jgi:cellulose synthase/poly-beta-1,6-N-acetylglucosamine synthase-like glycosyltransferase